MSAPRAAEFAGGAFKHLSESVKPADPRSNLRGSSDVLSIVILDIKLYQGVVSVKRALSLAVAILCLVSLAAAQSWFKGSLDDALAKAKTEGKHVLIDFFSYG